MVASQRARYHWWAFWAGVPIYGLLIILVWADVLSYSLAAILGGVCAIPLLAAHFLIDANNPNRNRDRNRKQARRLAKDGDIWVPEDRQPKELSDQPIGTGVFSTHYLCYAMLAGAVLAFFLPVGLKVVTGMKSNADWYPEVAGPGDSPYVYFKDSLSSVKKLWNAQARVTVINPADIGGPIAINATTNSDNWGNTISVKSSEKNSYFRPWARLQIPADPRLAGKTLQLQIDMNVTFPKVMGANQWQQQTQAISHRTSLTLSSSGAGMLLKMSFWVGFLGGTVLLFLAGGLLPVFSNKFRAQALETSIFVPEGQRRVVDDGEDEEEEDEEDERPRRRTVRREDEDDRPRKRRDDYYAEDNRPRARSRRDDDEDDDRPRRRERRDDEDDDRPRRRRRDD
jgi:hypothetical protein